MDVQLDYRDVAEGLTEVCFSDKPCFTGLAIAHCNKTREQQFRGTHLTDEKC